MRVVVDTNVLVSFAIRPNPDFEKLFDYLAAHGITLVSEETIAELFAVLSREAFRAYIPQGRAIDYVEWYAGISESVVVPEFPSRSSLLNKSPPAAIPGTTSSFPSLSLEEPTASSRVTTICWTWSLTKEFQSIALLNFLGYSPSRKHDQRRKRTK